jgi:CHAT domain-containing protein
MCKYLTIVVKHNSPDAYAVIAAFDLVQRRKAAGIAALRAGRDALRAVQRRKAAAIAALRAGRDALLDRQDSRVDECLKRLTQLRWQIARKSLAGASPGESACEHRHRLADWRAEREDLEAELACLAPVPDGEAEPGVTERLVSEHDIPDGAVLVEFVKFHVYRFDAVPTRGDPRWAPSRYLAFVFPSSITHDVELYDLGEAGPIDRWIAEFRAEVATDPSGSHRRDMAVRREAPAGIEAGRALEAGPALYDVLLRPLSRALGDRRRLLLAPDGDLNRLPFEVLPIGQGRRLIEEYEVSYLAVGRDLRHFADRARGAAGSPLVLADPDFDHLEDSVRTNSTSYPQGESAHAAGRRSADFELDDYQFDRLRGSRVEGEEVAALLGVEPVTGTLASESRLRSCRSPRVLHLATHGYFLSDQVVEGERLQAMLDAQPWMEDAILEARRAVRTQTVNDRVNLYGMMAPLVNHEWFTELNDAVDQEMVGVRRLASGSGRLAELELENPLLRSGLALAGANVGLRGAAPVLAEDGILTAEDVTGLDLVNTELVVLSACETGLGDVRTGEGVFGLRRAFVLAGAKTLVMSLWKVPDEQTRELICDFYRRLLAGRGRAAALREAQLAMKDKYSDPFYWGAFICQGDPSPLGVARAGTADASMATDRSTV